MLKVYICEDEPEQRGRIRTMVDNTILMEALDMELCCVTDDPHEIVEKAEAEQNVGVYFLDISLGCDMDGLALAGEIRRYDPRGFIVFVTTHSEMSYLTFVYQLEAMDYILKDDPVQQAKRIHDCLMNANARYGSLYNNVQSNITIRANEKQYTIDCNEIMFIETSSNVHKLIIHCRNREIEFAGRIRDIEKQLDERFYRCHRSFIVNKDNIDHIDRKRYVIRMTDGQECLVSVRMLKGLL